jgi:tetratricopeptide (TPR) repeat protein
MNVGWTYYIEGRSFLAGEARERAFDNAVDLAKKILGMDPSYYGSYMLMSGVSWRRSSFDEAIAFGRKAVDMEPNNTFPVAILAGILTYAGQPEEAILLYQRAMRLSPFYRPWYLDGLALAFHLKGEREKAIETFGISAGRDPKSVYPHVGLAVIYAEQGREEEMRAEAAEIVRLNPKFTIGLWTKSHAFRDTAVHESRKELMRKAGLPE